MILEITETITQRDFWLPVATDGETFSRRSQATLRIVTRPGGTSDNPNFDDPNSTMQYALHRIIGHPPHPYPASLPNSQTFNLQ
jgi:hypothetical protein